MKRVNESPHEKKDLRVEQFVIVPTCSQPLISVKDVLLWLNLCLVLYMGRIMTKPVYAKCEQQRRRSACASTQSDQHLCYRWLDSIISLVSISEISSLYIASVAAQAGLCLTWPQSLKTGFLVMGLNYNCVSEQRRLWLDCTNTNVQAGQSLRCSHTWSVPFFHEPAQIFIFFLY